MERPEQVPGNGERGRRPAAWTQSRQQGNPDPRHASRIRERPRHGDSHEGRGTRDRALPPPWTGRSEEHTSELQSRLHLVCRLLLEKKKTNTNVTTPHRNTQSPTF